MESDRALQCSTTNTNSESKSSKNATKKGPNKGSKVALVEGQLALRASTRKINKLRKKWSRQLLHGLDTRNLLDSEPTLAVATRKEDLP